MGRISSRPNGRCGRAACLFLGQSGRRFLAQQRRRILTATTTPFFARYQSSVSVQKGADMVEGRGVAMASDFGDFGGDMRCRQCRIRWAIAQRRQRNSRNWSRKGKGRQRWELQVYKAGVCQKARKQRDCETGMHGGHGPREQTTGSGHGDDTNDQVKTQRQHTARP